MKMHIHSIFITFCFLPLTLAQNRATSTDRLFKNLFNSDYGINSRPAELPGDNLNISLSVEPFFIGDLDEETAIFSIHGTLSLQWIDYRLTWNPMDYDQISIIRVPSSMLWLPDIRIYNSPSKNVDPKGLCNVLLSSTGKIIWITPTKFQFFCPNSDSDGGLQISGADRVCQATLGSWTYDGWLLNIELTEKKLKLEHFVNGHPKWKLLTEHTTVERVVRHYACCQEPYVIVNATFPLKLRWLTDVHPWQAVISLPCAIAACLALWATFSRTTPTSNIWTIGTILFFLSAVLIYVCTETKLSPGSTNAGKLVIWTTALVLSNALISSGVSALVLRPSIIESRLVTKVLATPVKNILVTSLFLAGSEDQKGNTPDHDEDYYALKNAIAGIVCILHAVAFITVIAVFT